MRTEEEINSTIETLNSRLKIKAINRFVNAPVKEGYKKAIEILKEQKTDIEKAGIEKLKTVQGRAIAGLAVYYLVGDCEQETLCNVPIKER